MLANRLVLLAVLCCAVIAINARYMDDDDFDMDTAASHKHEEWEKGDKKDHHSESHEEHGKKGEKGYKESHEHGEGKKVSL